MNCACRNAAHRLPQRVISRSKKPTVCSSRSAETNHSEFPVGRPARERVTSRAGKNRRVNMVRSRNFSVVRCRWRLFHAWALGCALLSGCAAFHPMHGVPARYLPEEYRGTTRAGRRTIDLSLLKRTKPPVYKLDSGDVLGVYIEGVLGDRKVAPPVNITLNETAPPSFGFPIPVREDGTISLPLIGTQVVRGLSVAEVETRLKQAYTQTKEFLNPDNDRILVSLQRPRQYRVLVIRQEAPTVTQPLAMGWLNAGTMKRGTGKLVSLPADQNDVMHALAETGGLPGLDAENAIYVIRRRKSPQGWTPPKPDSPTPRAEQARKSARSQTVFRAQSPVGGAWPPADSQPSPINPQSDYRRGGHSLPFEQRQMPMFPTNGEFSENTTTTIPMARYPDARPVGVSVPPGAWNEGFPPAASTPFPRGWQPPQHGFPESVTGPWPAEGDAVTPEQFGWDMSEDNLDGRRVIRIPIRLGPGETVDLREEDIILENGDIVFIEARDTEVFYTGGLLGGGQYVLPRDYDLNVLQAIAVSQGPRAAGGAGSSRATASMGGQSALNNDVSISASHVIILRYLPDGRMVPIEIDLYTARSDVAEQVIIQPGDYILLQYTKLEAIAAFFERHLLEGALFSVAAANFNGNGN